MQNWIHWLGPLHPAVIHFPIVCPILALLALAVDWYRPKSWLSQAAAVLWVVTFITAIIALFSGHGLSLQLGIVPEWSWVPSASALHGQLRDHAILGSLSLIFSFITFIAAWKIFRDRSWPIAINLVLGLILTVCFSATGYKGGEMVYGFNSSPSSSLSSSDAASPADLLNSLGNFHETLVKMNVRPWNSRTHGHRWVNTYVSKEAVEDYKNSDPLPVGSLVIKESFEDENNQPSSTPGPLYVMEKGALTDSPRTKGWLYALRWDHPVSNNPEKIKDAVQWLPGDAHLNSCFKCHSHFKDEDFMGGIPEGFEKP
jgi:uncharacterized membrane protein